jgi:transposase
MQHYDDDFKKKIVRLHIENARTIKSLTNEYGMSKNIISIWVKKYREECQQKPELKEDYDYMIKLREFQKRNQELEKENLFLKKAAAFFAREID